MIGQKEFSQNMKELFIHMSHDKDLHDAFLYYGGEKFWLYFMYLVQN